MIAVSVACLVLLAFTTLFHYEVLGALSSVLPGLGIPARTKLLVVMFTAFLTHAAEIALYGLALFVLIHSFAIGDLSGPGGASLINCLYFSAETYSSLGFGDVAPLGPARLIAGVEALNGLLLIGWSASFAYLAMERFWNEENDI